MSYLDNKVSLDTLLSYVADQNTEPLVSLLDFMKTKRLSPRWYATNSMNVKYKNAVIFRFHVFPEGDWEINLTVARESDLDDVLSSLSSDMQAFYFKNLRPCRHCNPKHGDGRQITILGNEYYICAAPEIQMRNPSLVDVKMLQAFVDIRVGNILAYK